MSAQGEFRRVLANLVTCLPASQNTACAAAATALEACPTASHDDLSGAAQRALEVCASVPTSELSKPQRDEYAERSDHLITLCRSLLG